MFPLSHAQSSGRTVYSCLIIFTNLKKDNRIYCQQCGTVYALWSIVTLVKSIEGVLRFIALLSELMLCIFCVLYIIYGCNKKAV